MSAKTPQASPGVVDSHCHLDYLERSGVLEDAFSRAEAAGVRHMLTISTRLESFPEVQRIAAGRDGVWCSVGVHPHDAKDYQGLEAGTLAELTKGPAVVAIGETGLDYHYDNSPREAQRQCFQTHIEAAKQTSLPLIVHSRSAEEDTAAMLKASAGSGDLSGLLHCFSSSPELAEKALEIGFYISLAGILTFNNAQGLRDCVAEIPEDRLLVETDAPYLAPVPKRGKPNEPAFIVHTLARMAELKGRSYEDMARITTENFFRLFSKCQMLS